MRRQYKAIVYTGNTGDGTDIENGAGTGIIKLLWWAMKVKANFVFFFTIWSSGREIPPEGPSQMRGTITAPG
jgi:hypothetical protein